MTAQRISFAAALMLAPACGVLALVLGQDANWDLRNYHYYAPYAFLTGRLGFDIAPAQPPTFYNPVLYLSLYWATEALPARAVAFLLGSLQGLNGVLLWLIGREVLTGQDDWRRAWGAWGLAALGLAGAGNLSEIGASFADNILSLAFLAALWLLLRRRRDLADGPLGLALMAAAAAGLLIGLTVGLKQPMAIYAVGLALACWSICPHRLRGLWLLGAFGAGGVLGIAASGGYWLWLMWERYANPLFPYMNHVFRSPWAPPADYRHTLFLPKGLGEALLYPLLFAADSSRVAEIEFRELRVALAYGAILIGAALAMSGARRGARFSLSEALPGRMVIVAAAGAYVAWLGVFGVYRYLIAVEMLAPLAFVVALDRWGLGPRSRAAVMGVALAATLLWLKPGDWGRAPWSASGDYITVATPSLAQPARTIVLMAGFEPLSYVIPKFPPAVRFLRIHSYFIGPTDADNRHNRLLRDILAAHDGPLFALFNGGEEAAMRDALAPYRLGLDGASCGALASGFQDNLRWCAVSRAAR
jgi:hypothetical protein